MTRIGIVGRGRAATIHAEAVRATRGASISGIVTRDPSRRGALADAVAAPELSLDEAIAISDGLVVAVPPAVAVEVMAAIPPTMPALVEPAWAIGAHGDRPTSMTAANLLHAATVTAGLEAIAALGPVHHLILRGRGPRPTWGDHGSPAWGGGVIVDPHAATMPVLLAAAGAPVTEVTGSATGPAGSEDAVRLTLGLADGRRAGVDLAWHDDFAPEAEIEAAGAHGVVVLRLLPEPELEIDGRSVARAGRGAGDLLATLGFLEQMARFVGVVWGDRAAWPTLAVGDGIGAIAAAVRALPRR